MDSAMSATPMTDPTFHKEKERIEEQDFDKPVTKNSTSENSEMLTCATHENDCITASHGTNHFSIEKYEKNYNDQIADVSQLVDETILLFPFVCGLCFDKFDNILKYYHHLKDCHEEVERYFHSHDSDQVTSIGTETRVYYCGKCSYVSPSLCQLHDHLVNTENMPVYQLFTDIKTAYPCLVNEEAVSVKQTESVDWEVLTAETPAPAVHSHAIILPNKDYEKPDTVTNNVKVNKLKRKRGNKCDVFEDQAKMSSNCSLVNETEEHCNEDAEKLVNKRKAKKPRKCKSNLDTSNTNNENVLQEFTYEGCKSGSENEKDKTDSTPVNLESTQSMYDKKSNRAITNSVDLMKCTNLVSNGPMVKSNKCKKVASSWKGRNLMRDSDGKPVYANNTYVPCEKCGLKVLRKRISCHMTSHTETREFPCEQCGICFKSMIQLKQHVKTVHVQENSLLCQVCGKSFKNSAYLRQHTEIHSERDQQCPRCPRAFCTAKMLRHHMQVHRDEKFRCELCEKEFTFKGSLSDHVLQVHNEVRPFACGQCGKTFKLRHGLRKHIKIHEPPQYSCSVCSKTFVKDFNRKVHLKLHIQRGECGET